jgi:hypothetical protein
MTPNERTADACDRAAELLRAHPAAAPTNVHADFTGRIELAISSAATFSEESRRAAADLYAQAVGVNPPTTRYGYYLVDQGLWRISTPVRPELCPHCGSQR